MFGDGKGVDNVKLNRLVAVWLPTDRLYELTGLDLAENSAELSSPDWRPRGKMTDDYGRDHLLNG